MLFCPHCGNILLVESAAAASGQSPGLRFYCQTCPYIHGVTSTVRKVATLARKKVEDVLDVEASWKNAQEEDHTCPACGHGRAKFVQMQTRSADEAATIFYKCCNCGKMSKDN